MNTIPCKQCIHFEQQFKYVGGKRVDVSLRELIERKMGAKPERADLFISQTRDGELLITSRQDGTIRMLVPDNGGKS